LANPKQSPFIIELLEPSARLLYENHVLLTHYVPGSTLYRLIARFSGRVPEAWVRFYATELVLGLEHVHACGLIHRFLAPENILISKTGHLRLSCFGSSSLAPFVPHQAPDDIQTLCARYNTLYMAPEMLRKVGYGQSVDWWAVGTIMHEMLAGSSRHHNAIVNAITGCEPQTSRDPVPIDSAGPTLEDAPLYQHQHQPFSAEAMRQAAEFYLQTPPPTPDSEVAAVSSASAQAGMGDRLHSQPSEPPQISQLARSLIAMLTIRNPERRLGTHGVHSIKQQAFFAAAGVDWDAASYQMLRPPWIPELPMPELSPGLPQGSDANSHVWQGVLTGHAPGLC